MNETAELGFGAILVVDELDFDGLHWSYGKYSLANSRSETTEKSLVRRQVSAFIDVSLFQLLESAKSDRRNDNERNT